MNNLDDENVMEWQEEIRQEIIADEAKKGNRIIVDEAEEGEKSECNYSTGVPEKVGECNEG